jgi:predicted DNA-binding protein (UPF0251 family)
VTWEVERFPGSGLVALSQRSWNFSSLVRRLAAELPDVMSRPPRARPRSTRQRQVRLSPDELAELVAEYQAGFDSYDLAVRWGVHRHTVSEHLKRAGVQTRFQGLADFQVAEAKRLYLAGWSLARLGEHFDCDASTVHRALRLAGMSFRRPWERP